MFLFVRRRIVWMFFLSLSGVLTVFLLSFFLVDKAPVKTFAAGNISEIMVVVDPGHGGEDGGAVSPSGVTESNLNLEISLRVYDLLCLTGQKALLTRTEDRSIHTEGNTIRERKASDIRRRVETVNGNRNTVLLSIHQNSLPSSTVTHGAQVFWNHVSGAEQLAKVMQDSLNGCINVGNEKQPKKIASTIYLMKHVTAPAVLIECGFLSNHAETELLQTSSYQKKIAAAIVAGYLRGLSGEEVA